MNLITFVAVSMLPSNTVLTYFRKAILLFLFRYYHLIEMPFVRNVSTFAPNLIRVLLSKPMTPFPNRFIPHLDSAIEHHFFDVPLAEGKGVVEPHNG